jgi:hypothetical protein
MMEAVRTSETSVDNHFTRQYNPQDNSEHHTRRRENLKSHTEESQLRWFGHVCSMNNVRYPKMAWQAIQQGKYPEEGPDKHGKTE